ncbi:ureidoglycolate lyase [Planktotalea sp.]|uniref:ureidoglycolate lyase n=1 Tax=Planktotalea sp. TaxID=2029877 RepID=UPI0025CF663F|nr:ureidoglycolate lyase [Planktotalea sp.]
MSVQITIQSITAEAFAPYGDLIDCAGDPDMIINLDKCGRYHDRANMDFGTGRAGLSLFNAQLRTLPYEFNLVERHPLGSQAFIPMSADGFLVIVAPDVDGTPGTPIAFETQPGQGINFHKGTWHGVLTPLSGSGQFAVVDRIGDGNNLTEFSLDTPHFVVRV